MLTDAKYGHRFMTEDGRIAFYNFKDSQLNDVHYLMICGFRECKKYCSNGRCHDSYYSEQDSKFNLVEKLD